MGATTANSAEFQNAGKPTAHPVYIVDTNGLPKINGASTTVVSAGTSADTVVKSSAGTFWGMVVTSSAAGTPTVWDNASGHTGTAVAIAPASTIGSVPVPSIGVTCLNGITLQGSASNPAVTIYWS